MRAIPGTNRFGVRVFITKVGAAEEEVLLRPDNFPGPIQAGEMGRAAAEKKLGAG